MNPGPGSDNPLEWLALQAGLVPVPVIHTQLYPLLGRAVLEATRLGVFRHCGRESFTVGELAASTTLALAPLQALLDLLAAAGYFKSDGQRYQATALCRRYCLPDSPEALTDQQLFNAKVIWPWTERLDELLQHGHGVDQHQTLDAEGWSLYQGGMANFPKQALSLVVRQIPVPRTATRLLDLGGGPGIMAQALQARHPKLEVEIMDLPEAVQAIGDRRPEGIVYHTGNVLSDPLGQGLYDCVIASNLIHHFSIDQARDLAARVRQVLCPGGTFAVLDFYRPPRPDFITAATHLFFQLTSTAGVPSSDEITACLAGVGFAQVRFRRFKLLPGFGMVYGIRS